MNRGIDTFLPMIGQVGLANVGTSTVNAGLSGAGGSWAVAPRSNTVHANSERNMTATSRTVLGLANETGPKADETSCRASAAPSWVRGNDVEAPRLAATPTSGQCLQQQRKTAVVVPGRRAGDVESGQPATGVGECSGDNRAREWQRHDVGA